MEAVSGLELLHKLRRRIYRGVHFTSKAVHGWPNRRGDLRRPNVTDDHQVNVARRMLCSAGHRTVYECPSYPTGQRLQELADHIDEPDGLNDDRLQFRHEWTIGISLVVHAIPVTATLQDACRDERGQLSLQARRSHAEMLGQIGQVPRPLRPW